MMYEEKTLVLSFSQHASHQNICVAVLENSMLANIRVMDVALRVSSRTPMPTHAVSLENSMLANILVMDVALRVLELASRAPNAYACAEYVHKNASAVMHGWVCMQESILN